jgi:RNA polymerase sigma-70 factor (ECF subfamily)
MAPLSDDELVAAAQGGDRNALDQLLRRHYDRIYAVCRRVTGGTRDADDACQEALIKITRSLPRFDGRSTFGTWAYRIATNASLDELRGRKRRPMLHSVQPGDGSDDDGPPELVDPMAAKRVDAVADRLAIDEALGDLSDDFKAAVVLRDVADLDYDEIADILEIPVGTVKSRIARGRAALAHKLRLDDLLDDPANRKNDRQNRPATVSTEDSSDAGNHEHPSERPTDSP